MVASSPSVRGLRPLTPLRPQPGRLQREDRRLAPGQSDTYRVAALGVARADGTYTVLVGESREAADDSVEDAGALLLLGCPFLIGVVAAATYLFVGRSLAPVEGTRRKVAVVTADRLGERVPVPEARDEVARLAETMNAMLDRLQTRVDARRRFVADAGHELRSPITTLHGGLEVLATRPLAARDADMVALLTAEVGRLDHLVDGLLWLARADEHGLQTRHTDVDLDDLVDTECRRLAARHPGMRITADPTPARVRGDAGQLAQVLRNLADNAATHASSAVRLAVPPSADGHTVVLEVADDGPGVPPPNATAPSAGSYAWTRAAAGTPAAWDWAWPSCTSSWPRITGVWTWARPRAEGRCSESCCPRNRTAFRARRTTPTETTEPMPGGLRRGPGRVGVGHVADAAGPRGREPGLPGTRRRRRTAHWSTVTTAAMARRAARHAETSAAARPASVAPAMTTPIVVHGTANTGTRPPRAPDGHRHPTRCPGSGPEARRSGDRERLQADHPSNLTTAQAQRARNAPIARVRSTTDSARVLTILDTNPNAFVMERLEGLHARGYHVGRYDLVPGLLRPDPDPASTAPPFEPLPRIRRSLPEGAARAPGRMWNLPHLGSRTRTPVRHTGSDGSTLRVMTTATRSGRSGRGDVGRTRIGVARPSCSWSRRCRG